MMLKGPRRTTWALRDILLFEIGVERKREDMNIGYQAGLHNTKVHTPETAMQQNMILYDSH